MKSLGRFSALCVLATWTVACAGAPTGDAPEPRTGDQVVAGTTWMVAGSQASPHTLVAARGYVYWLSGAAGERGAVARAPRRGDVPPTILAEGRRYSGLAVAADDNVYFGADGSEIDAIVIDHADPARSYTTRVFHFGDADDPIRLHDAHGRFALSLRGDTLYFATWNVAGRQGAWRAPIDGTAAAERIAPYDDDGLSAPANDEQSVAPTDYGVVTGSHRALQLSPLQGAPAARTLAEPTVTCWAAAGARVAFGAAGEDGDRLWLVSLDPPVPYPVRRDLNVGLGRCGVMTADAARVYWTDGTSVRAVRWDGTDPRTLVADQRGVGGLALDDENVYWSAVVSDATGAESAVFAQHKPRD